MDFTRMRRALSNNFQVIKTNRNGRKVPIFFSFTRHSAPKYLDSMPVCERKECGEGFFANRISTSKEWHPETYSCLPALRQTKCHKRILSPCKLFLLVRAWKSDRSKWFFFSVFPVLLFRLRSKGYEFAPNRWQRPVAGLAHQKQLSKHFYSR